MRIAFFDDKCSFCEEGGAQKNNFGMLKEGFRRGHDIKVITPQNMNIRGISDCDLVIIANCVSFPRDVLRGVVEKFPVIWRHHDFAFWPSRLFYPLSEEVKDFEGLPFWKEMYTHPNTKLHIWLSPLHREGYLYAFPELEKFRKVCIPSCLDTSLFKQVEGVVRQKNTVIGINCLEPFKSRYGVYNWAIKNEGFKFTFVGNAPEINIPNATYLPYVPNEELPKLLSQHEFLIHLPDRIEPFGRIIAEARLCACKLIVNDNVGAMSYPFMKGNLVDMKNTLDKAGLAFWEEIEKAFKDKNGEKDEKGVG